MKKIFSMLLISALMISALAVFSACRDDSEDEPEKASKIDVSSYTLVRGDDVGDELVKYSLLLRDLINKHTGADVNLKGDFAEPSEKEILIGETERAESKTVYAILEKAPKNAYVIKAIGNKIVIAGKTEDATIRAMKRFLENNVKSAEGTVLNMDTAYEEKGTVDLSSVLFDNFAEMIPEVTLDMAVPNNISTGYSYETMIQLAHNGDKNGMLIASHASLYGYDDGYKMYRSYDNGDTWEVATRFEDAPSTRIYIGKLKSGRVIYVRNISDTERNGMKISLSEDGGVTYPWVLVLDDRKSLSYPDVAEGKDGNIYIVHDRERHNGAGLDRETWTSTAAKEILICKVTEEDIMKGKLSPTSYVGRVISKAKINKLGDFVPENA